MNNELKKIIKIYDYHSQHIIKAQKIYDNSKKTKSKLDINILKYNTLIIQTDFYLNTQIELINSIFISFKNNHFTTIETLARISIEMAVNLLLIITSEEDKASNGLLKHYFDYKKNKTKKWMNYSKNISDSQLSLKIAQKELEKTEAYEQYMNFDNHIKWPQHIYEKFEKLGLEETYRTVFASASDSVHTLSEDIFNLTILKNFEPTNYKKLFRSEKKSFSIYLMLVSIEFFNLTLYYISDRINNSEVKNTIEKNNNEIIKMIEEHNNQIHEAYI